MRLVIACALVVAVFAGGFFAGSLHRDSSRSTGPVVVSFRGGELRAGDIAASVRSAPEIVRAQLATREARRELVDGVVRVELLAAKAQEKGYDRDPEFVLRTKQELGALYLAKEFDQPEKARSANDDDVQKFFEEHRAERSRPERARVAMIAFLSEDAATRPQKRSLAQAALAEARRRANDYYAFGTIARLRSEEPRSRAANGELPPAGTEELATHFGQEVADAVFEMEKPGLLGRIVESPKGFFVVRLLSRDAAYEPKLEDVKDAIRSKLTSDRRDADLKAFLDRLWTEGGVKVDDGALEKLTF